MRLLSALGKVVLFDALDCWRQPEDGVANDSLDKIRLWFEQFFRDLPVDGVIFANRTMAEDLRDLVPNPSFIYHHYRPTLRPVAVREQARVVGYEGEAAYLGPWRAIIESACRKRGLSFVVNPADFSDIDIGVAARGGEHASLMARRYKSNVKLANFYGAGIPCVVHSEDVSYRETDNGEVRFFASAAELEARLDELLPLATRRRVQETFLTSAQAFTLASVADRYERYIADLVAARRARARAMPVPSKQVEAQ